MNRCLGFCYMDECRHRSRVVRLDVVLRKGDAMAVRVSMKPSRRSRAVGKLS